MKNINSFNKFINENFNDNSFAEVEELVNNPKIQNSFNRVFNSLPSKVQRIVTEYSKSPETMRKVLNIIERKNLVQKAANKNLTTYSEVKDELFGTNEELGAGFIMIMISSLILILVICRLYVNIQNKEWVWALIMAVCVIINLNGLRTAFYVYNDEKNQERRKKQNELDYQQQKHRQSQITDENVQLIELLGKDGDTVKVKVIKDAEGYIHLQPVGEYHIRTK